MGIIHMREKLIKRMKWYDLSYLKAVIFFFTLFLVTGWSAFRDFVMQFAWPWYLVLAILFAIPLLKKMC